MEHQSIIARQNEYERRISSAKQPMGISGAQKRKKKKEKEELALDVERLKLGPTKLWTGLVVHHKDVFVSHVIPKLNGMDRYFLSKVNTESQDALKYAGVKVSKFGVMFKNVHRFRRWNWCGITFPSDVKMRKEDVIDQALFCLGVSFTNKLEFLKWAREVKRCEWDEETIKVAAARGNLEMLKYCFSNGCPCDKKEVCEQAAYGRTPRLSSISFGQSEPFAKDGRRCGTSGSRKGSRGHREISH